tara:strand:+ start:226 stop:720 length:495 start_codon:yes stop_codon:yes gene_type:complete
MQQGSLKIMTRIFKEKVSLMKKYSKALVCCTVLSVVALVGCGNSNLPATVTGVVTVNGSPAPSGLELTFRPSGEGVQCYGVTDNEGRYTLAFTPSKKGCSPGANIVTVAIGTDTKELEDGSEVETVPDQLKDIKIAKEFQEPATHNEMVEKGPNTIDLEIAAKE